MAEERIYERVPEEETNKKTVLQLLEAITALYQRTLHGLQVANHERRVDSMLIENFYNYFSCVIALYKMLKPKIPLVANPRYLKLGQLDGYVNSLDIDNPDVNLATMFDLFRVFNYFDDLLRNLVEELGYTADRPAGMRR